MYTRKGLCLGIIWVALLRFFIGSDVQRFQREHTDLSIPSRKHSVFTNFVIFVSVFFCQNFIDVIWLSL